MMQPLVSIITVCFNSQKTIKKTIQSVLDQSYPNIEYIIIDGASSDSTLPIIKEFMTNSSEDSFILVSEPDKGIYNAMNKGINMAKGELIGIINSDDWYETDAVETVVSSYLQHKEAIHYGFMRIIKFDQEYLVERSHFNFLNEKMIQHPTCFVPKKIYELNGLFDESFKSAADYDFMLRIKKNGIKFITIDRILANFTVGGVSGSDIGLLESLKIKYMNNIISKKTYNTKKIELKFKASLKRFISYKIS
ncbi:glycosyltransferase family 2 protein [Dyadobacter frigoris]|uniref:Glycosyltransferase n=1 Tax=Dyadobacter frigoris TaxID=2576211 RepID=A0A4V6BI27_9BACT|nr:glycosyltransferase family 2 protein [Dyadobacter frigoris]TKT87653.1 glycosyltransferase [Dyadobacter frigoris]